MGRHLREVTRTRPCGFLLHDRQAALRELCTPAGRVFSHPASHRLTRSRSWSTPVSEWVHVALVAEFPSGERRAVDVEDITVIVFNLNGDYFAIEDVCTHDYSSLDEGELDGDEIICPRHGARFNVRTGEALTAPAYEAIATFPVRVHDGSVQVKDERWD